MADLQIARPAATGYPFSSGNSSIEQERREVLESVMSALSSAAPDPGEMAACSYLLKHLAAIPAGCAARPGVQDSPFRFPD
jgi:hypothetical protein